MTRATNSAVRKPRLAKPLSDRASAGWEADVRARLRTLMVDQEVRSNRAFARKLGVHSRRVSDWTGWTDSPLPSAASLRQIGETLNVSMDWLLALTGDTKTPLYRDASRSRAELSEDLRKTLRKRLVEAYDFLDSEDLEGLDRELPKGDSLLQGIVEVMWDRIAPELQDARSRRAKGLVKTLQREGLARKQRLANERRPIARAIIAAGAPDPIELAQEIERLNTPLVRRSPKARLRLPRGQRK